jgi:hypothetical protein
MTKGLRKPSQRSFTCEKMLSSGSYRGLWPGTGCEDDEEDEGVHVVEVAHLGGVAMFMSARPTGDWRDDAGRGGGGQREPPPAAGAHSHRTAVTSFLSPVKEGRLQPKLKTNINQWKKKTDCLK